MPRMITASRGNVGRPVKPHRRLAEDCPQPAAVALWLREKIRNAANEKGYVSFSYLSVTFYYKSFQSSDYFRAADFLFSNSRSASFPIQRADLDSLFDNSRATFIAFVHRRLFRFPI